MDIPGAVTLAPVNTEPRSYPAVAPGVVAAGIDDGPGGIECAAPGPSVAGSPRIRETSHVLPGQAFGPRAIIKAGIKSPITPPQNIGVSLSTATTQPLAADDPMTHVRQLASCAMAGRDSPSTELDKAAVYIAGVAQRLGLEAPVPTARAPSYLQTFDLWGSPRQRHGFGTGHGPPTLFERGFHLSAALTDEDLTALESSLMLSSLAHGGRDGRIARIRAASVRAGQVSNVLAYLPGTGPQRHELILLMAHYDHVGSWRGEIYPGADDNASGSAVLLSTIAQLKRLQGQRKLNRSILFLWTAAEEKGLVGSHYYARNPLPGMGNDAIAGVINMDMVGRLGPNRLSVIDSMHGAPNYFRGMVDSIVTELAPAFTDVRRDIDAYWDRQDGAVFSRSGEDVLTLFEGLTDAGGLNPDYHRPSDTIDRLVADGGDVKLQRVRDLVTRLAVRAANRVESLEESPL